MLRSSFIGVIPSITDFAEQKSLQRWWREGRKAEALIGNSTTLYHFITLIDSLSMAYFLAFMSVSYLDVLKSLVDARNAVIKEISRF